MRTLTSATLWIFTVTYRESFTFLHDRNNNNGGDEHLRVIKNVTMNCLNVCQRGPCTDAAEASELLSADRFKDVLGRSENIAKTDLKKNEDRY